MDEASEALAAGRLWAVDAAPYLATALFAMSPTMVVGSGTMGIDRYWRLYVDPRVFEKWSTPEVGAVLIHEAHHRIRAHAERASDLGIGLSEQRRFNVAADFEINDDLRDLPLPAGGLDPVAFGLPSGELAETYYLLIESRGDLPVAECGSGAHGVHQEWELPGEGGLAVDELESELIRQQVAQDIRIAHQAGGDVPAGLERWAQAFLHPKVDWRREFAAHVRAGVDAVAGAVDYSYRRPSRRSGTPIGRAVVLPALVQPVPRVAVVVDTSASMSQSALSQALAEIGGILRASGIGGSRLAVLSCDSSVRSSQQVFSASQVSLLGGGGTDMGAGIATAVQARPRPEIVVVVTDGFTPWPSERPASHVVVTLIGDGPEPPAWARYVRVAAPDA
jgi:predicted metal-dependent peptidase